MDLRALSVKPFSEDSEEDKEINEIDIHLGAIYVYASNLIPPCHIPIH